MTCHLATPVRQEGPESANDLPSRDSGPGGERSLGPTLDPRRVHRSRPHPHGRPGPERRGRPDRWPARRHRPETCGGRLMITLPAHDGTEIRARDEGQGPVVLVLHPALDDRSMWATVAARPTSGSSGCIVASTGSTSPRPRRSPRRSRTCSRWCGTSAARCCSSATPAAAWWRSKGSVPARGRGRAAPLARARRWRVGGAEPAAPARPPAGHLARGLGCAGWLGCHADETRPPVRQVPPLRPPRGRNPRTCSTGPPTSSATRTKPAPLFDRSPYFVRHTPTV
jgi:hypothetical protein